MHISRIINLSLAPHLTHQPSTHALLQHLQSLVVYCTIYTHDSVGLKCIVLQAPMLLMKDCCVYDGDCGGVEWCIQ